MTSLWTGFIISVVVLTTVEGVNVALNKVTKQSSTQHSYGSHKAVDGDTEQIFLQRRTCTWTYSSSGAQWWWVDLGEMYNIDFIIIWNRADCCADRLRDFSVYVGTVKGDGDVDYSLCFFHGGYFTNTKNITCDEPQTGRFVKIELPNGILTLCEVEVHAKLVPPTSSSWLSEIDQSPTQYTEIPVTPDAENNLMLQSTSVIQTLHDYILQTTPAELVFSETILSTFDASALQTYTDMSYPPLELETSHTEITIVLTDSPTDMFLSDSPTYMSLSDSPTDMSLSETPVADVSQGFTSSIAPSLESVAPAGDVERLTYVRCGCFCLKTESPAEQAAELKENLQMDTGNLSSSIRKKTSAKNKEASATYLGGLGIAMITIISVAVLLPDVITVMSYLWTHTRQKDIQP